MTNLDKAEMYKAYFLQLVSDGNYFIQNASPSLIKERMKRYYDPIIPIDCYGDWFVHENGDVCCYEFGYEIDGSRLTLEQILDDYGWIDHTSEKTGFDQYNFLRAIYKGMMLHEKQLKTRTGIK